MQNFTLHISTSCSTSSSSWLAIDGPQRCTPNSTTATNCRLMLQCLPILESWEVSTPAKPTPGRTDGLRHEVALASTLSKSAALRLSFLSAKWRWQWFLLHTVGKLSRGLSHCLAWWKHLGATIRIVSCTRQGSNLERGVESAAEALRLAFILYSWLGRGSGGNRTARPQAGLPASFLQGQVKGKLVSLLNPGQRHTPHYYFSFRWPGGPRTRLRKRTVQLFLPLVREMFPDGVEMRTRWGSWAEFPLALNPGVKISFPWRRWEIHLWVLTFTWPSFSKGSPHFSLLVLPLPSLGLCPYRTAPSYNGWANEMGWPSDTKVSCASVTSLERHSGIGGTEGRMWGETPLGAGGKVGNVCREFKMNSKTN